MMAPSTDLTATIRAHPAGLTLAELLARHPQVARRTAQRWLGLLIAEGSVTAWGAGRARRYWATAQVRLR